MENDTIIETVTHPREVERLIIGKPTSDGAGVKLTRVLTNDLQRRLDPFLMLDAFRSDNPDDWIGGFPDHPHRGFETVTYMITGRMRHRDSAGNQGLLQSGGVQWMTAGRGVIHSELPEQQDGLMEGFQLWVNLPASDKMTAPWYRDIPSGDIPSFSTRDGVTVRVIAGESSSTQGAVQRPATQVLYLDIHLPAGSRFEQTIPSDHNAFAYVYRGAVTNSSHGQPIKEGRMALFANDSGADGVVLGATEDSRVLLISGKPLREPIAQYGPFVMNTQTQIREAIDDYQAGRLA